MRVFITNKRDTTRTQSFTYDALNRIVTAKTSATTGSNCWGESYQYDNQTSGGEWGNLTGIGALSGYSGCTVENLSVSATTSNQLSSTGFSYDAAGNMLNDGANAYGYNAESEMKSAAGVTYTYDGDGNRIEKSNGKIYWYGAGTEILDESDTSGNFTNEYVFFGGKRVAMRNVASGNIYYYEEDMLGSARTMLQAGQTSVCYDGDFYPFGGERVITSTCTQNYKFEGKERDTETGLDDFGVRYNSSRIGRFMSPDPFNVSGWEYRDDPQSWNGYSLTRNNPLTLIDPQGDIYCNADGDCITDQEYAKHKKKYKGEGYTKLVLEQTVVVTARPPSPPISPFDFPGHWFVGMGEILLNGNVRAGAKELLWAYGGNLLFGAALGGIEDLAGSSGALEDASQAAFKAAGKAEDYEVLPKHLAGAGGGWAKFAAGVDAKAAIREALASPNAQLLPNGNDANSFVVIADLGRVVGSNGQTAVKVVFDRGGNIWTAYPVNPR